MMDIPEIRDTFNVSGCLLQMKINGFDNDGCFTDIFLKGTQKADFFEYSNITETTPGSQLVDGCLVFSGPAQHPNPATAAPFVACLESYANATSCSIPSIVWSGRSANRMPVASMHTMLISDMEKRKTFAQGEVSVLQANVLTVLDQIESTWTGSALEVSLFSAEADLLHQVADCHVLVSNPSLRILLCIYLHFTHTQSYC